MNACVLIISQKLIDSRSFPQRRWFPADLRWVMWRITQRWQETSSSTASGLVSKSRCQTGSLKEVQICLFLCLFSKNLNSTSILCPQGSFLGKVRYLFLIILSVFERTHLLYSGLFKYPPHPPPLNFFFTLCIVTTWFWNGLKWTRGWILMILCHESVQTNS